MADWGQRPKDKDRDDAIAQIEAAAARGQIVDADKVKRIQEVKSAGSVGELELITRGLAAPAAAAATPVASAPPPVSDPAPPVGPTFQPYQPPTAPPVTEPDPTPPPTVQYGEALTPSAGTAIPTATAPIIKRSGHGGKLVLLFVLIMIAGIAIPVFIGIKALVDTAGDALDDLNPGSADVFSADGIAELTEDIEKETGSTRVFSAVLYPDYAVVSAPADGSRKRYISYYWNGSLSESSKGSGVYNGLFDMRDIDAQVVTDVLAKARKLVEGSVESNYVVVSAPGPDGAAISAYASNDFSETGYLTATFDGKIVNEYPPS
ncbi:MAG TPA: hypothetical protein VFO49_15590 [Nocardioides sp.]|nr:hypothetical protein [Nocardioides sp.]